VIVAALLIGQEKLQESFVVLLVEALIEEKTTKIIILYKIIILNSFK
jgi:hypothetical protein